MEDYIDIGKELEDSGVRKDGSMGTPAGDIAEGIGRIKHQENLKKNETIFDDTKVNGNKGFDRPSIQTDDDGNIIKGTIIETKQKYGSLSDTGSKGKQGSMKYIDLTIEELLDFGTPKQIEYAEQLREAFDKGLIESKLERVDITTGKVKLYDLDEEGNIKYDTKIEY